MVNLAFAPEPWLRWEAELLGAAMPKRVSESLGLYRARLHPQGTPPGVDGWWDVTDEESARMAVTDIVGQLSTGGWALLESMFSREMMRNRVRNGDLGLFRRVTAGGRFLRAEALLLMDDGPSDALESTLDDVLKDARPEQRPNAERFVRWVRSELTGVS